MLDRARPQEAPHSVAPVVRAASWLTLTALLISLIAGDGTAAQPKKKPHVTPHKPADGETSVAAAPKPPRKVSRKKKDRDKNSVEGIADFGTAHFLLHTDLSDDAAEELLDRLETMLELISKYWGRASSGVIEMFVVKDLSKWPAGSIPGEGLDSINGGAGITVTRRVSSGDAFLAKSIVYAIADRGTPQHEVVHAYCGQTFGRTGPLWYSEGMAEMGQYWRANDFSVNAHPQIIRYLRNSQPKRGLLEIVNAREITGDSWQNYAWRWALCHLLANNVNYHGRFHSLGLALLTNLPDASFEQAYGPMAQEISFEYRQFLQNVETGYRADLCSWDWKAKFKLAKTGNITQAKIEAQRGWQPSRLIVSDGEDYEFSVNGKWSLHENGPAVDPDGDEQGRGRVVGALLTEVNGEYQLGEPFELGKFGSFQAPGPGSLYLRCRDDWSSLADNRDSVIVRLKLKSKGPPLAPPKDDDHKKKTSDKKPAPESTENDHP
ncbi:MAG: hypothetical protein HY290_05135 [Planctomycetia bacterium]|nr:hypothetical protein [Planctomycetia bacterium]